MGLGGPGAAVGARWAPGGLQDWFRALGGSLGLLVQRLGDLGPQNRLVHLGWVADDCRYTERWMASGMAAMDVTTDRIISARFSGSVPVASESSAL